MIRVRLFRGKSEKTFKAFREPDIGYKLAKDIFDVICEEGVDIRLEFYELTKGIEFEETITQEFIEENKYIKNGPVIWRIMEGLNKLKGAPDLVQERIKRGESIN